MKSYQCLDEDHLIEFYRAVRPSVFNELQVVVVCAEKLPAMDSNYLTGGTSSSDPFVRLTLGNDFL